MNNNSPVKAFLVILVTALVCSSLVSATVVVLRPIQLNNKMLERSRNIIKLTGLVEEGVVPSDEEMLEMYRGMDVRIVDIDQAVFNYELDPLSFDPRRAVNNPELGVSTYPLTRIWPALAVAAALPRSTWCSGMA